MGHRLLGRDRKMVEDTGSGATVTIDLAGVGVWFCERLLVRNRKTGWRAHGDWHPGLTLV